MSIRQVWSVAYDSEFPGSIRQRLAEVKSRDTAFRQVERMKSVRERKNIRVETRLVSDWELDNGQEYPIN